MYLFAELAMSQRWSAILCATGAWGGEPIGRVRVDPSAAGARDLRLLQAATKMLQLDKNAIFRLFLSEIVILQLKYEHSMIFISIDYKKLEKIYFQTLGFIYSLHFIIEISSHFDCIKCWIEFLFFIRD